MILNLVLDALATLLPLFDKSSSLLSNSTAVVRWDAFHFLSIAEHGYQYEQQWAFLPGIALVIRLSTALVGHQHCLKGVAFLISLLTLDSYRVFYELSLAHLRSESLAYISTVLALIPSSPVTLFAAPYNEPFFTYLSYRGMLFCAQEHWLLAALAFCAATMFRSNGLFLAGFIIWGILIQPHLPHLLSSRKLPRITSRLVLDVLYAALLTILVFAPFIYHNYFAYATFCIPSKDQLPLSYQTPQWCSKTIPTVYTHVQSTYWNAGFLNYWSPKQFPNFLIAAPPFILLYSFGFWHIRAVLLTHGFCTSRPQSSRHRQSLKASPFSTLSLTPHVIHSLFTASILLFTSHTQIILRLAAAMPILYWAAAWLWSGTRPIGINNHHSPPTLAQPAPSTFYGKLWVYWSVCWFLISIILWTSFLPPA
ncbi:GPI mannosyltransferase 2 [Coprinopsis marcescibilis]|uniref:GPI mannosyltransferase 2 n=1 Tax=Coprinopsis marcescibilis TaxID=230819 RepID=A0A5C3KYW5_COPMA|nr:GPI mannosyltransferase 2 [Coprinopsis marcescibilis]